MTELNSKGKAAIWLGAIIFTIDVFAVWLRVFARRSKRLTLGADDYLILLAVPLELLYIGLLLWGVIGGGGGAGILDITAAELTVLFKSLYVTNFFINTICTLVKVSILCLYRRIFGVSKYFQNASRVVGGLCLVWYIIAMCFATIPCQPISTAWTVGPDGPYPSNHCINFPVYFVCIEVTNVVLDVLLLCLPIRMIMQLQLPKRQKIYVSGIFLLGGFVCITGLLRVAIVYKPGRNLSLILLTHFSILETGVAILCACLPTYRPLLAHQWPLLDRLKKWYGSQKPANSSAATFQVRDSNAASQFNRLGDLSADNDHYADAMGGFTGSGSDREDHPLGTISMIDTVRVSYHDM